MVQLTVKFDLTTGTKTNIRINDMIRFNKVVTKYAIINNVSNYGVNVAFLLITFNNKADNINTINYSRFTSIIPCIGAISGFQSYSSPMINYDFIPDYVSKEQLIYNNFDISIETDDKTNISFASGGFVKIVLELI